MFWYFVSPLNIQPRSVSKIGLVAARAVAEPPAAALDDGVLGDGDDVDGDRIELLAHTIGQRRNKFASQNILASKKKDVRRGA